MGLFRRFFNRKPPDRLLEISERVYVFDCCFSTEVLDEEGYKVYLDGIVQQLQNHFPEASFMVLNFREGQKTSHISDILSKYGMTVMDYPSQYEGCPLLPLEMVHHFLRSSESWLSLVGQQNVLLMHCEGEGWPLLAFMLAGLLLYRKQNDKEQKTLEMIYKQAPRDLLHLLSPLNPLPSQLRYLRYIFQMDLVSGWPLSNTPLRLDQLILQLLPVFDGGKGCRPVVRIYGQELSTLANRGSKLLFSTLRKKEHLPYYSQAECKLVKIDVHCRVQGDVVLECVHLDGDLLLEEMIFRVMFHTAFLQSNMLILNHDEVDLVWDAKDQFPMDFRAEVLFSNDDDVPEPNMSTIDGNKTERSSPAGFFEGEVRECDNWVVRSCVADSAGQEEDSKELQPPIFQDCRSYDGNNNGCADVVKDIAVDDVKYKRDEQDDSHQVKDIDVDDGNTKPKSLLLNTDVLRYLDPPEVADDACSQLKEMEDKGSGEDITTKKKLESKFQQKKLSADGYKEKSERLQLLARRKQPRSVVEPNCDSGIARQRINQQEAQGLLVTQAKVNAVPRWLPSNQGSYTNSMHVSCQIPRDGSAPTSLATTDPPSPPSGQNSGATLLTPAAWDFRTSLNAFATKANCKPCPPPPPPPPPPLPPPLRCNSRTSTSAIVGPGVRAPPPPLPPPIHGEPPCLPLQVHGEPAPKQSPIQSCLPTPHPPPLPMGRHPPPPPPVAFSTFHSTPDTTGNVPPPRTLVSKGVRNAAGARVMFGGRERGLSLLSEMGAAAALPQRPPLKPLHWSKLTRMLQGSLWEELQRYGEPQIAPEFDLVELETLFSATVAKPADSRGNVGGCRKLAGSKNDKVHLIELRRANNIEIMLTKVKMPLSDMTTAVLGMDESVLDVDQVENLIKFCPTKEEIEKLSGYSGNKENLGKCEQFFLELMKVPRVESKLRVFSFKIQFGTQISELKRSLNTIKWACEEVRNSLKLKEIMKKILYLGNTLNQGTARGSALGFKLDSLLKLTDIRASNNKMTLMHYLCKVIACKSPVLLDFHKDLNSLEAASKIQLKSLAEEMQAIIKGLEKVKQELAASEIDGPISEVFCEALKDFIATAETEVTSLKILYSAVGKNADALALYFGEDPAFCSFQQVTTTLLNFVKLFLKAHEENCKHAELERRRAKEAGNESGRGISRGLARMLVALAAKD